MPASGKSADSGLIADGFVAVNNSLGEKGERIALLEDRIGEDGGVAGASAYEVAVAAGFVGTQAEWLASLKGEPGAPSTVPGPKGDTGAASTVPGPKGDTGDVGPKGDTGAASTVPGPKGDTGAASTVPGPKGDTGLDGKSAYDIARDGGYGGTQTQWLASLKGAKGDTGDTGPASTVPGPKGDTGAASTVPGPKGDTGDVGPKGDKGDPAAFIVYPAGTTIPPDPQPPAGTLVFVRRS